MSDSDGSIMSDAESEHSFQGSEVSCHILPYRTIYFHAINAAIPFYLLTGSKLRLDLLVLPNS